MEAWSNKLLASNYIYCFSFLQSEMSQFSGTRLSWQGYRNDLE